MSMNLFESAVKYSADGWVVHPLTGPQSGGQSPGKRPIVKKWQYMSQPHDEAQLKNWFVNTNNNLGLVCGKASNIIVIDIDHNVFADELFYGIEIDTLRARRTAGRGHVYFKYTDKVKSQKHHDMGFEVLSDGNNAVLPPSIHESGDQYHWIDDSIPIAAFPDQLVINIMRLVEKKKRISSLVGKCRECFRKIYSDKPDMHGANGRELMLAFCTELKANGADLDDIVFVAKIMYGTDFDFARTENEFRNIDKNKTWQCRTLHEKFPDKTSCRSCNVGKKTQIKAVAAKADLPSVMDVAETLYQENPFIYDRSKLFWLWMDNHYEIVDEIDLVTAILEHTGNVAYLRRSLKGEILDAIRITGRRSTVLPLPKSWIQFNNTVIDVAAGEQVDVDPSYFFTSPIPHNISDSTDTPNIDQLFTDWVGEDAKPLLYEICAYCMLPSYPIHRMFWFLGTGRNGKSRFMALVRRLVGTSNTTSTELERMAESRFESAKLYKKLVAFVGETDHNVLRKTNILKALTGDDPISGEIKGGSLFDFFNAAKILIASNSLPAIEDKTEGWYARNIIIDFPNKFPEGVDVIGQIEEWEIENMCRKCVNLAQIVLERGEFFGEGTLEEKRSRYEESSNPIKLFMDLYCEHDVNNDIPMFVFRDVFVPFLAERGYRKMGDREISMKLKSEGFEIKKIRFGDKTWNCLAGVKMNNTIVKKMLDLSPNIDESDDSNTTSGTDGTIWNTNGRLINSSVPLVPEECSQNPIYKKLVAVRGTSGTNGTQLSQLELLQTLVTKIKENEQNGKADIMAVLENTIDNKTITLQSFKEGIRQLKRQGTIFEPKEGYYKVI